MALVGLSHYAIRLAPEAVDNTAAFYADVLGMTRGHRPPFKFPGAWLYAGNLPLVHLIGTADQEKPADTGRLDHIAFDAKDIAQMRAHLTARGVAFTERQVPGTDLRQLFVHDPNGIRIELNYRGE
jgi:catechol 2,3-dioxygenase-like lactoylglutathione lyase family enzyme